MVISGPGESRVDTPVSAAVLERIADREGMGVEELRPRLYDVIDPDALDMLFRNGSGTVVFEYLGYEVTVDHDHNVAVAASPPSG